MRLVAPDDARRAGVPEVDLDHHAVLVEHVAYRAGHPRAIHPVERLAEADDPEGAERGGKLLGPHPYPGCVVDLLLRRRPRRLRHHGGIGVEADGALEQRGQDQGDAARPAAHVVQPPPAVEPEMTRQRGGERGGVRLAAAPIVRRGAAEDGLVPDPVLPRVAERLVRRHVDQCVKPSRGAHAGR
jgi:hypothetical protein